MTGRPPTLALERVCDALDAADARTSRLVETHRAEVEALRAHVATLSEALSIERSVSGELAERVLNAQWVLESRRRECMAAEGVSCVFDGCVDENSAHQPPQLTYTCRCATPRYACAACLAVATAMQPSTRAAGVRCPLCSTVFTEWRLHANARFLPERWRVEYGTAEYVVPASE